MRRNSTSNCTTPKSIPVFLISFVLCFLLTAIPDVSAQHFKPFEASTKALYTTWPEKGITSSLSFINASADGSDSIFSTLKRIDTEDWGNMIFPDSSCTMGFWGTGGTCFPLNSPLWFGRDIRQTSDLDYQYVNTFGDSLHFDFSLDQTDSILIYQNEVQHFYLIYEYSDTSTWLNHSDSVAHYRIAHLDINGTAMNSAVHNAPVVIGKDLGMIQFLRIDSFPLVLQPIQLAGHVGAEAGISSILVKDIYDFNVGDIFQYKFQQSSLGPQAPGYTEYRNISILSRTETNDSIFYNRSVEVFKFHGTYELINGLYVFFPDTTYTLDTTYMSVSKTGIWEQIPLEAQDTVSTYRSQNFFFNNDDCGPAWTLRQSGSRLEYCSADSTGCYGDHSNLAPGDLIQIQGFLTIGKGVGIINSYGGWEILSGISNSQSNTLLYHEKNGVSCGQQWVLGTNTPTVIKDRLKVYPNPAQTFIQVVIPDFRYSHSITQVEIYDLQGRMVMSQGGDVSGQHISIENLNPGIYVVNAITRQGAYTQKLIIGK